MVKMLLRTADGRKERFISDIIMDNDVVRYIRADESEGVICKKHISELRIEGDTTISDIQGEMRIRMPPERTTTPRYNEFLIFEEYTKAIRECKKRYTGRPATSKAIFDIKNYMNQVAKSLSGETGLDIIAGPVIVDCNGRIEIMQPTIIFPNGRFGLLEYAFDD